MDQQSCFQHGQCSQCITTATISLLPALLNHLVPGLEVLYTIQPLVLQPLLTGQDPGVTVEVPVDVAVLLEAAGEQVVLQERLLQELRVQGGVVGQVLVVDVRDQRLVHFELRLGL